MRGETQLWSMSWGTTSDVVRFDGIAGDFLRSRPVENTVLVTVLEALRARGAAAYGDTPAVLGSWLPPGGCVSGAFVHTPPFPLLLSLMPQQGVRELVQALKDKGAGDILVICGGVIPQQDYDFLYQNGVKAIFGPGTNIPNAARDILRLIREAKA